GCQVIATDCPSGPAEILSAGQYGILVPVGDSAALSLAMLQVLKSPLTQDKLMERARYFSTERAVSEYLAILN
ncbi:MAG: glycosyltransferase family 4 protein, partial [Moorea sp. SIO4G2]|nr:glycosyltransferase family 4 protein [Moorena sp. SIO4G2]